MASSVAGWADPVQISYGIVNADGTTLSGSNFVCVKIGTGSYTIVFTPPFGGRPTLMVSQIYPNDTSYGGDTRDNALAVNILPNQAVIATGDSGGNSSDRMFSFIALGPQGDQAFTSQAALIRGSINADASVAAPPNRFGVAYTNNVYNITYTANPGWTALPAVVTKQAEGSNSVSTRDNAVIVQLTAATIRIKTGDNKGNPSARSFQFLLAGPVGGAIPPIQKLLFGSLNNDGSIKAGYNFDTVVVGTGVTTVVPTLPFPSSPTVVATQDYPGQDTNPAPGHGKTTDNVVLSFISATQFTIQTGDYNGNHQNRPSEFIALC